MAAAPHVVDTQLASPELALVDPVLATRLRSLLPVAEAFEPIALRDDRQAAAGSRAPSQLGQSVGWPADVSGRDTVKSDTVMPDPLADVIVVRDETEVEPLSIAREARDDRALSSALCEADIPAGIVDDADDPLADLIVGPAAEDEPRPSRPSTSDYPVLPAATVPATGDDAHVVLERIQARLAAGADDSRLARRVRRRFTFTLGATVLCGLATLAVSAGLPHVAF